MHDALAGLNLLSVQHWWGSSAGVSNSSSNTSMNGVMASTRNSHQYLLTCMLVLLCRSNSEVIGVERRAFVLIGLPWCDVPIPVPLEQCSRRPGWLA